MEKDKHLEYLREENEKLENERVNLLKAVNDKIQKIKDLEVSNEKVKQIADKINKELSESRTKSLIDNNGSTKAFKAELKLYDYCSHL